MSHNNEEAKRFRQFRKKYIGSQLAAAAALDVSQKHISHIETGKSGIGLELVRTLVKKYKINANWFLTGTGNPVTNLPDQRKLIHDVSDLQSEIDMMKAYMEKMKKDIKLIASEK